MFDGRCAAQGFNPLDLDFARLLNLYEFCLIEGADAERREEYADALSAAAALYAGGRETDDPVWWTDDDEAGASTMAAMTALRGR